MATMAKLIPSSITNKIVYEVYEFEKIIGECVCLKCFFANPQSNLLEPFNNLINYVGPEALELTLVFTGAATPPLS